MTLPSSSSTSLALAAAFPFALPPFGVAALPPFGAVGRKTEEEIRCVFDI